MRLNLWCLIFWGLCLPLRAQVTHLVPNPFSPGVVALAEGNQEPGLAIRLSPPADSLAFVRIHIYSTRGTLVRTLSEGAWVAPEGLILYWDGLSDDSKMVRNGRYVAVIQWSRHATRAPFLVQRHSVVVFK